MKASVKPICAVYDEFFGWLICKRFILTDFVLQNANNLIFWIMLRVQSKNQVKTE